MKNIITFLTSLFISTQNLGSYAQIDRIEDNNIAIASVYINETDYITVDIPQEDFKNPKKELDKINICKAKGKFYNSYPMTDNNGKTNIYYQFKSNDSEVWWILTEDDIGYIPNKNIEYTLFYYNNETTKYNKPCNCLPEYECECELYDDIFIFIISEGKEV